MPPTDPAANVRICALAREKLGDNAFAAALQVGRSLSLSDAMIEITPLVQDAAMG